MPADIGPISLLLRGIVITTFAVLIYGTVYIYLKLRNRCIDGRIGKEKENSGVTGEAERSERRKKVCLTVNTAILLGILTVIGALSQIKINYNITGTGSDTVLFIICGMPPVLFFTVVIYTYIMNKREKETGLSEYGGRYTSDGRDRSSRMKKDDMFKIRGDNSAVIDFRRKIWHVISFVGIISALLVVNYILKLKLRDPYSPDYDYYYSYYTNFWGSTDPSVFLGNIFRYAPFSATRSVFVLIFTVSLIFFMSMEIIRFSGKLRFPFDNITDSALRPSEYDEPAGYVYFVAGMAFSAFMLPSLMFLSVLSVCSFADTAASSIGIRLGTHRYRHNGKSLEGTLAGAAAAFILPLLITGPVYALVSLIIFVAVDIYTPKPIGINDNLAVPLLMTAAFILLSLAGIGPISLLF